MSENDSTTPAVSGKPAKPSKPRPDFPLTAHPAGYWCKKIRGKIHYFGPWSDPAGALAKYNELKEDLHAGRTPLQEMGETTVKDACNAFLNAKQDKIDAGELSLRTFQKYQEAAGLLVREFGKRRLVIDLRPSDFARLRSTMAKRWGPLRLADMIQHIRSVFKNAYESDLVDRPVKFGPGFARPAAKVVRLHKAKKGPNLFTAAEVRKLLDNADVTLKAWIYLGVNAAFGNADIATLPLSAIDLKRGWVSYHRSKTGAPRRCPLWPETLAALKDALAIRPQPQEEYADLAFVSQRGTPICSMRAKNRTDGVAVQFGALLKRLKLNGRPGLGYYTLRHCFRTVADEIRDEPAINRIMGHDMPDIANFYREVIADDRLRAVAEHVRQWLLAADKAPSANGGEEE